MEEKQKKPQVQLSDKFPSASTSEVAPQDLPKNTRYLPKKSAALLFIICVSIISFAVLFAMR